MNAIVLSGGNTKGCYQAGALLKLETVGKLPDTIYGTSVGAVNGFAMAYGNAGMLVNFWKSLRKRTDIISRDSIPKRIRNGFPTFNLKPLEKLLISSTEKVVTPRIRLVVTYVDLFTGKLMYADSDLLSKSEMISFVIASAAEPPWISPISDQFVDGGVRDQTPLKKPIDDGADKILAIINNPYPSNMEAYTPSWPLALRSIVRVVSCMSDEIFMNDIKQCLTYNEVPGKKIIDLKYIAPSETPFGKGSFSVEPEIIEKGIDVGFRDMEKKIYGIAL